MTDCVMLAGLLRTAGAARAAAPAAVAAAAGGAMPVWPLSAGITPDVPIASPFGPRWQASQARYDWHPGLDLPAPCNTTPVHAAAGGWVSTVGWLSADSGLSVIISHTSLNSASAYLHLSTAVVSATQTVTQGQVIGYVGNSGTTEFCHLHFEIRLQAGSYPTNTRNPMGYLPRPDVTTPVVTLVEAGAIPVYSPTVKLAISVTPAELDLNQIRVTLRDLATGALVEDQLVDFNLRLHTGSDDLQQDGIRLEPAHFNTSTVSYVLTATFTNLHGFDAVTLTAQAVDLAGHAGTASVVLPDATPPGQVNTLRAAWRSDGGVDLAWLATGDSDSVGRALTYQVRYLGQPLNNFNWSSAVVLAGAPAPVSATLGQVWAVPGPLPAPVYFALKVWDSEGNESLLSNSALAAWRVYLPLVLR